MVNLLGIINLIENASLNDLRDIQKVVDRKKMELYEAINEYDEKILKNIVLEELTGRPPHVIALTQNRRN